MVKLTKADVLHVAKLANLNLSPEESEKFLIQLTSILGFVSELNKVDTDDIPPTSQTTGLENITREDAITPENCLTQEEALSGTDSHHNGFFKVDAILTERSNE